MASGALVIRSNCLCIQFLATAANRTGHLVTEGKISLPVMYHIRDGFPASTGQLVDKGYWMASGDLSNS